MSQISSTGFWTADNAVSHHVNCAPLGQWFVEYFKDEKDVPLYDFGCGMGFYANILQQNGFKYVTGFEGDPPQGKLFQNIVQQDLTKEFHVPAHGNALFLEVAEHIPAEFETAALSNVINSIGSGKKLVMSWAIRGQAGFGHVNCLDNHEAIAKVEAFGFKYLHDDSMAARAVDLDQAPWFRNTILVFQQGLPKKK